MFFSERSLESLAHEFLKPNLKITLMWLITTVQRQIEGDRTEECLWNEQNTRMGWVCSQIWASPLGTPLFGDLTWTFC